jgi:MFS family permease
VIASLIFTFAQIAALTISNPNLLSTVSSLTGLAYGFLFGVYPSLVAEAFGVHGLSQNWGCMTLAPVISGNIFNLFYGAVYDKHSIVLPGGERECLDGLDCYKSAYWVTFCACMLGLAVSLWSIHHAHAKKVKEELRDLDDHDA